MAFYLLSLIYSTFFKIDNVNFGMYNSLSLICFVSLVWFWLNLKALTMVFFICRPCHHFYNDYVPSLFNGTLVLLRVLCKESWMRGLRLEVWCCLKRQHRMFLVVVVLFSCEYLHIWTHIGGGRGVVVVDPFCF